MIKPILSFCEFTILHSSNFTAISLQSATLFKIFLKLKKKLYLTVARWSSCHRNREFTSSRNHCGQAIPEVVKCESGLTHDFHLHVVLRVGRLDPQQHSVRLAGDEAHCNFIGLRVRDRTWWKRVRYDASTGTELVSDRFWKKYTSTLQSKNFKASNIKFCLLTPVTFHHLYSIKIVGKSTNAIHFTQGHFTASTPSTLTSMVWWLAF